MEPMTPYSLVQLNSFFFLSKLSKAFIEEYFKVTNIVYDLLSGIDLFKSLYKSVILVFWLNINFTNDKMDLIFQSCKYNHGHA